MLPEFSNQIKPLIRIRYGPYLANGILKHREEKLKGLIECLEKLDYVIELIPTANLNLLVIEILGCNVHEGVLKFLQFNTDCEDDEVCQRIVCQVKEALHRMYNPASLIRDENSVPESVKHREFPTIALESPVIGVNHFRTGV